MASIKILLASLILLTSGLNSSGFAPGEKIPAWVYFNKKGEEPFRPAQFFTEGALERRVARGIDPYDYSDSPVNSVYLEILSDHCMEIAGSSRWLNAALVIADQDQLNNIRLLAFVDQVEHSNINSSFFAEEQSGNGCKANDESDLVQLDIHEASLFRDNNLSGKGIKIAVFDGGFPGVDTHPAFRHLHENKQIISTWDFAGKSPEVYKFNNHGTAVLSCICGIKDSIPTGMATGAEFLLARTELSGEPWKEELYWIQAAEWADRMGADIISSSLGYTYHRYFQRDLTGRDTPVARAANIAASKGILVINCIGNEGDNDWKYAVTPADADSVLSVGGVDPATGLHIPFSSFGPNMSGDMKPNVMAAGTVIAAGKEGWKTMSGTSFSTPLITGFAACAWQQNPSLGNMDIFRLIEQSGHLYPYYDFAHGFGIPKASHLLSSSGLKAGETRNKFEYSLKHGSIIIEIDEYPGKENLMGQYLFYSFRNVKGETLKYGVYQITSDDPLVIPTGETKNIEFCYLRTTDSYQIIKL